MKKGIITTSIAIVSMVVFAAYAFADGARGRGYHQKGAGYQMGDAENCPGFGKAGKGGRYLAGLSEEDAAKVQEQRKAFLEETKDQRRSVYQKKLEMRAEMAKKDPDVAKLTNLQKEVSGLKADLDLKRLKYHLEIRKLVPDYQAGGGPGRGPVQGGECWRQ